MTLKQIWTGWLAAGFAGSVAFAGEIPTPRTIQVNGQAEVKVVPDEVVITVGIESVDLLMAKAKKENDGILKKALDLGKEFKLDAKEMKVDYLNVEPRYYQHEVKREFMGYFVRRTVVFSLKDLTKFDGFVTGLLDTGVNYVQGIEFKTSDLRKYRDQARAMAVKAAKDKATDMAKELGQKVGLARTINEGYDQWRPWYGRGWNNWGGGYGQQIVQNSVAFGGREAPQGDGAAPGTISVNASVSILFDLE